MRTVDTLYDPTDCMYLVRGMFPPRNLLAVVLPQVMERKEEDSKLSKIGELVNTECSTGWVSMSLYKNQTGAK